MTKCPNHSRKNDGDQAGLGPQDPGCDERALSSLSDPPFTFDNVSARQKWLWRLAFHTFETRAAAGEKLDTRFVIHLSELLDLAGAAQKQAAKRSGDGLGEFLHGLSVEEFAEYKRQCRAL